MFFKHLSPAATVYDSEDHQDQIKALFEKRAPRFQGK